jgi:HlyD family secretion protein
MKRLLFIVCAVCAACAPRAEPDAYGNVEATPVVVSSETAGRLVTYTVTEGETLAPNTVVATIDSAQLAFERQALVAERAATASRVDEVRRQASALDAQRGAASAERDAARAQRDSYAAQLEIATRAHERTSRLFAEQAATAQQLDQAERDRRVLAEQVTAQDAQIRAQGRQIAALGDQLQASRAQEQTVRQQVAAADAQIGQVGERVLKTEIRNPIAGTVLATYAKPGETVQAGQPLYRIADLRTVDVRAYVTEPQLSTIRLGQQTVVTVDAGRGRRQTAQGAITWISSQAEFTPTPIQTRDERAAMVYAIKIRVPNESGTLKIGMPADVQFAGGQAVR